MSASSAPFFATCDVSERSKPMPNLDVGDVSSNALDLDRGTLSPSVTCIFRPSLTREPIRGVASLLLISFLLKDLSAFGRVVVSVQSTGELIERD